MVKYLFWCRSVPPRTAEDQEFQPKDKDSRKVRSPPPYSHVYSLPDYEKISKKRVTSEKKLPRSRSDYNLSKEQPDNKGTISDRPRHLRRRQRELYEEVDKFSYKPK